MKNKILLVLIGIIFIPNVYAFEKNKFVYSQLNTSGNLVKTSVTSELIINNNEKIKDETELKNILNINGKETYEISGNNINWTNNGNNIFYNGELDKILPVEVNIKYYLNNKEVDIKDLYNKKGSIKIVYSFKNNSKKSVLVNGKNESVYTPFVVTLGTIIKNENNSNISIDNGEVVSSGNKSILIGLSSPGLYESLGLKELSSLNKITIKYDTKKFSKNDTYVVLSSKLLDKTDLSIFDKLNETYNSINTLQSSMDLIDSSSKELSNSINKINNGTNILDSKVEELSYFMNQIKDGSIKTDEGLKEIINVLEQSINYFSDAKIQDLNNLKLENTEVINSYTLINNSIKANKVNECISSGESDIELCASNKLSVDANYIGNVKVIKLMTENNNVIDNTLSTINNLKDLYSNLVKLEEGTSNLSLNIIKINDAISLLNTNVNSLNLNISKLNGGAYNLSSGISTFNEEGVKTITNYSSTFSSYTNKINALVKLSKNYNGFASNNSNNTTFIYVIK